MLECSVGERPGPVKWRRGRGWACREVYARARAADVAGRVVFTGFIPSNELPALYSMSDLFVFPSLYEGFGIPVLEAMACGVPVVCSNRGALPEVAGDAAVQVDPLDVAALAAAMERALRDGDLRRTGIERGRRRAAEFPWRKTAERTEAFYRRMVSTPVGDRGTDRGPRHAMAPA